MIVRALTCLSLILGLQAAPALADVRVSSDQILVDGKPFQARGASGDVRLDLLKRLGATVVRTYGEPPDDVLDRAQKLGLKVIVGFWMEHPRRGFNYADPVQANAQLERLKAFVERYRDHPALLMWGVGNEVEVDLDDDRAVWPAIGDAARLVRRLDPHHPVMAVLAEAGGDKVSRLMKAAPDVDVLGINSYGDALPSVPQRVRAQGWRGPIVIAEMGAEGQWQAPGKPWGASIEPSSTEKAARLRRYLKALVPATEGQVLFYWGQKQEVTATWHGLLLADGAWTEAAEAMAEAWGGALPGSNRAPRIGRFDMEAGRAVLEVTDPDGDALRARWSVTAESTDPHKGGDLEAAPKVFERAVVSSDLSGARLGTLPAGNYRLFVEVTDGRGAAATANVPFQVK